MKSDCALQVLYVKGPEPFNLGLNVLMKYILHSDDQNLATFFLLPKMSIHLKLYYLSCHQL